MKIENIQKAVKAPVIATFDLNFDKMGFIVSCQLIATKKGGFFVSLPQKTYKDSTGAWKYEPLCRWSNTDKSKGFSNWCIEELKGMYPGLFEPQPISAPTQEKDDYNDDNLPF